MQISLAKRFFKMEPEKMLSAFFLGNFVFHHIFSVPKLGDVSLQEIISYLVLFALFIIISI